MGFRNVWHRVDAALVGPYRARRVAQIVADQPQRKPSATIARLDIDGSFEFDAGRRQIADLSQA